MKGNLGMVDIITSAAAEKKANDIKILNVSDLSPITDYFVICSANSTTQVKAIADEMEYKMKEAGYDISHREGYSTASWILLDFQSVIAHVFKSEDREFYDIERLWADAEVISV